MKTRLVTTALLVLGLAGGAQASTVDLTDNSFTDVSYETYVQGPLGPIVAFDETVDGVTFSVASLNKGFSGVGTWGSGEYSTGPFAMNVGGGGVSPSGFTMTADKDVTLSAFYGFGQQYLTNPVFDVTGTGVSSTGNTFGASGSNAFAGGALSLVAGETYTFDITNAGAATVGFFTAFEFEVESDPGTGNPGTTPVPLPAGLPMLMAGVGVLGLVRRRS